jgi:hypothetical protein
VFVVTTFVVGLNVVSATVSFWDNVLLAIVLPKPDWEETIGLVVVVVLFAISDVKTTVEATVEARVSAGLLVLVVAIVDIEFILMKENLLNSSKLKILT